MMSDFAHLREMDPYRADPPAMPAGAHGKRGYLRMGFELDAEGRSILRDLERHTPLIVQQELYFDEGMPEMPCVYILSSGGPQVDGDRYEQQITLRRGAFAHVATGAATKLAEMRYNFSGSRQRITLEADAYLEYLPEPTIPCRHTRFCSETTLAVDPSATLFHAEIYASGRRYFGTGERFAYDILSISTRGERPDGALLFQEKLLVRPAAESPSVAGAMADYDLFATAIVMTPGHHAAAIYARTEPFIDPTRRLAAGISLLPGSCGLLYRVLGNRSGDVKQQLRSFCDTVRRTVKGHPLPSEFPWR